MEWYLRTDDAATVTVLRREVMSYLRRHASADSDLPAAELVVAELLANAYQHAPGPLWVRVDWGAESPRVEVHDLGPGFDLDPHTAGADAIGGRGLFLAHALADDLSRASKRAGGSKVTATLPVDRRQEISCDPPISKVNPLPAPEEAQVDGTFGKESFLRALVVELAQAVVAIEGPAEAEALVAQVGANVGQRMEDGYRAAREITGRLAPDQIAELYVRLKAAINGDFYVIDVDDHRIVLGNRCCPFGSAVLREPGLCRMTSSVFGGIAARNTGAAAVVLEERIAVATRSAGWWSG